MYNVSLIYNKCKSNKLKNSQASTEIQTESSPRFTDRPTDMNHPFTLKHIHS